MTTGIIQKVFKFNILGVCNLLITLLITLFSKKEVKGIMSNLTKTQEAILRILISLQGKYNKNYVFPTQKRILELLEAYYGIKIHRRALCYALADLQRREIISRLRRIKKNINGGLIFQSTLYFLKSNAYKMLNRIRNFAQKITRFMINADKNRERKIKETGRRKLIGELITQCPPARPS